MVLLGIRTPVRIPEARQPGNNRTFNLTVPRHSNKTAERAETQQCLFLCPHYWGQYSVNNSNSRNQTCVSSAPSYNKPGAARTEQKQNGPRDNRLVECYRCHQMGHIATRPQMPATPYKDGSYPIQRSTADRGRDRG